MDTYLVITPNWRFSGKMSTFPAGQVGRQHAQTKSMENFTEVVSQLHSVVSIEKTKPEGTQTYTVIMTDRRVGHWVAFKLSQQQHGQNKARTRSSSYNMSRHSSNSTPTMLSHSANAFLLINLHFCASLCLPFCYLPPRL